MTPESRRDESPLVPESLRDESPLVPESLTVPECGNFLRLEIRYLLYVIK